jgi:hypothetical protein
LVAYRDHHDARLTKLGELMDLRGRHFGAADIDDNALGRSVRGEVPNCAREAASPDRAGNRELRKA